MFFEMRFDLGTLDSGERSLPFWLLVDRIIIKVAGNQDRHKSSDDDEMCLLNLKRLYLRT